MRIKLDIPLRLSEISSVLSNNITEELVHYICTDSREVMTNDLFISLASDNAAALKHIRDAKERGALTVGIGGDIDTDSSKKMLAYIAKLYKSKLNNLKHTVMITGSVGKTTTKEILFRICSHHYRSHKSDGNFNNDIGVPLTMLGAKKDCEVLILEAGMNHRGEISQLSQLARPSTSIITSIGTSHIGNLGSREEIAHAKLEILDGMDNGTLICNDDEPLLHGVRMKKGFSVKNINADYALIPIADKCQSDFEFYIGGKYKANIHLPFPSKHIVEDIASALAASDLMQIPIREAAEVLSRLDASLLRHRLIECGKLTIMDDSYNSSPEALRASLDLMSAYDAYTHKALIGDILELGDYAEGVHVKIGELLGERRLSRLYLRGTYAESIKYGAMHNGMAPELIRIFSTEEKLSTMAKIISDESREGDMLLVKASHGTGLHKIINCFKGDEHA